MQLSGIQALIDVFGGTRPTWKRRIEAGMPCLVRRSANAGKPHEFDSLAVLRWLTEQAAGRPSGDLDPAQERARLDNVRRLEIELKIAERRQELIPAEEVHVAWVGLVGNAKRKLLALPHRLAPRLAAESDVQVIYGIMEAEIHGALTELSEEENEPYLPTCYQPLPAADGCH